MKFFNRIIFPALVGIIVVVSFVSCEEDLTTLGGGVLGGDTLDTEKVTFGVIATNKKIKAIPTNKLPIYQLGNFNDPIYGKTTAKITSEIQLPATSSNVFGKFSQEDEDDGLQGTATATIQENEEVTAVYLNIPYLTSSIDTDGDGVVDALDSDKDDPNSDTDGDGLTDSQEGTLGTDPLNSDTDGDGTNDSQDTETRVNQFPRQFDLDSIYGKSVGEQFKLKVERSNFFLRDLDPEANFEEAQEYFSNHAIPVNPTPEVLFEGNVIITDVEQVILVDDVEGTDEDESLQMPTRIAPGIRVKLDNDFFQNNILDKEGSSELENQANFKDFIRGLQLSVEDDVLLLLDLKLANITIEYQYDVDGGGKEESTYEFRLLTGGQRLQTGGVSPVIGNAINTLDNEDYPTEISDSYNIEDASKIYLKGGAGSYVNIELFNDVDLAELKQNNWIINEANLVFYVDQENINGSSIEPLRLYLFNAETNAPLYSPLFDAQDANVSLNSFLNYGGILEKDASGKGVKYTIRITDYVNDVIAGATENAVLGLTVTSNINFTSVSNTILENNEEVNLPLMSSVNPLGTVLFGGSNSVAEDKRLELEISYTTVN